MNGMVIEIVKQRTNKVKSVLGIFSDLRCLVVPALACCIGIYAAAPVYADDRFDPWEQEWVDPWSPSSEVNVRETPTSISTVPTLGDAGFWPLLRAMSMYEQIEEWGGWQHIPAGERIALNDRDDRVPLIRGRLVATGDLAVSGGDPTVYDEVVFEGTRRFQSRNGLTPDGVIGSKTLAAMNVPVAERIKQLAINLKRLNELSETLGRRYVFVNIAGQVVEAVSDGTVDFRRRVIVGKEDRQTPEYNSSISFIALNPYWNVPRSIAEKDLIPKARRNPGYFERLGIRVYRGGREVRASSVNWHQTSARDVRLRQDPSPRNSLGTVKIHFNNPYAVYLHDTPSKSLFGRTARTYSSGCVRVEDVHDLTEWLLSETPNWDTRAAIDSALSSRRRVDVPLAEQVPIYMLYLTAWVDEYGVVQFRDDVYDIDRRVRTSSLTQ
jgi:L,D-transpeptidase YcbB